MVQRQAIPQQIRKQNSMHKMQLHKHQHAKVERMKIKLEYIKHERPQDSRYKIISEKYCCNQIKEAEQKGWETAMRQHVPHFLKEAPKPLIP